MPSTLRPLRLSLPAKQAALTRNLSIARALPRREIRAVGPFMLFDHLGPVRFPPGDGLFVPPHPHKGLETVTYLFEGAILHKDSLGNRQRIVPGDVNWMTAGRGIVHSEETEPELKRRGSAAHGLQTWVALPEADRLTVPDFIHHPAGTLPIRSQDGVTVRVLAGGWEDLLSPVKTFWPLLYLDLELADGAALTLSPDPGFDVACYAVAGRVAVNGTDESATGVLTVFERGGKDIKLRGLGAARLVVFGGLPLKDKVVIWDNFILGSIEEARQAQQDFLAGRFGRVE